MSILYMSYYDNNITNNVCKFHIYHHHIILYNFHIFFKKILVEISINDLKVQTTST